MIILGIETSCDETSISIKKDDKILVNIVSSQIKNHIENGGVIPELASRLHLKNFPLVLNQAISESNIEFKDIDHIAYTKNPGLIGCLKIGEILALTLGLYLEKPVLPVNHLEAHIYGAHIGHKFEFPALVLLVSGGHTQLIFMKEHLNFQIIGETQDDAIGECYDKVARMLGLNYPGGPIIDKLSAQGKSNYELPISMINKTLNFSYSGLKSAANNLLTKLKNQKKEINIEDFCNAFQKAAIGQIQNKLDLAISQFPDIKSIVVAGGVSANSYLRSIIKSNQYKKFNVIFPKLEYCTDNAAMVVELASYKLLNKIN
ncbi:tRNA (adenosine(37)-N6)-threonylcarbamoyltransferase complex transferase subunit TsaD [Spiroplasma endosymbiont of Amphibalanus improvisus]|uniref:tRNA (adenosine(37)-N6)-threonylcarbamoyltransferase complex transferase subunit TsaD n=1 Tax=Spiroplasma endosymbiont of Amphibalanus improvisus TaxID=3066327 RepID=UPI00313B268E